MDSTRKATCATYCLASPIIPSTASKNCSPGMSRPKLLHTHSTLPDRSFLLSRRPSPAAYCKGCLRTVHKRSGGEGGIVSVVVEREVRVGERWYVSCFQRLLSIRRNRQCLCG